MVWLVLFSISAFPLLLHTASGPGGRARPSAALATPYSHTWLGLARDIYGIKKQNSTSVTHRHVEFQSPVAQMLSLPTRPANHTVTKGAHLHTPAHTCILHISTYAYTHTGSMGSSLLRACLVSIPTSSNSPDTLGPITGPGPGEAIGEGAGSKQVYASGLPSTPTLLLTGEGQSFPALLTKENVGVRPTSSH